MIRMNDLDFEFGEPIGEDVMEGFLLFSGELQLDHDSLWLRTSEARDLAQARAAR